MIKNNVGSGAILLPRSLLEAYQGDFKKDRPDLIKELVKRIKSDGFIAPIFIWQNAPDNRPLILDGHQRLKALSELAKDGEYLEDDKVPTIGIVAASDKEAWQHIFSYNRQFSEIDADIAIEVADDLGIELSEYLPDLNFTKTVEEVLEEDNYVPPDEIATDIVVGDTFELISEEKGITHRLACGSSTDPYTLERLFGEKTRADMVFTDPPYLMAFD